MPRFRSIDATLRLAVSFGLLATILLAAASIARAGDEEKPPDLSGTYAFTGKIDDSTDCSGTLEIKKRKTFTARKGPQYNSYDLKMEYAAGWKGMGVGTFIDGRFHFAIAQNDEYLGVVVYRPVVLSSEMASLKREYEAKNRNHKKNESFEVKGDPWWTDVWTYKHYGVFFRADGAWGFENLGPEHLGDSPPLGNGKWGFVRTYYEDKGKANILDYRTGELTAEVLGDAVKISQSYWVPKKRTYDEPNVNAGLMPDANTLVAVFNGSGQESVGSGTPAGMTIACRICNSSDLSINTITLTVPPDVAAKNPGLFH